MKCPKCGHDNPDIRLFCVNCGELLPENADDQLRQDAAPSENAYAKPVVKEPAMDIPEKAAEVFDVPENRADNEPVEMPTAPARPALERRAPVDNSRANTYIPKRSETMDPDDFFAVRGQVLPEYDDEDSAPRPQRRKKRVEYEDEAPQPFAMRHMRGIVTIALLAVTAAIMLIWVNTDNAQLAMAKIDIAWQPEAYATLGDEAYTAGDFSGAGYYYTQALGRDADNSDYAVMAANSYIEGGYTSKALEAIRECIRIAPKNADLYTALMDLQGGYENMPASDRQLVDEGYKLTGDVRLNKK